MQTFWQKRVCKLVFLRILEFQNSFFVTIEGFYTLFYGIRIFDKRATMVAFLCLFSLKIHFFVRFLQKNLQMSIFFRNFVV